MYSPEIMERVVCNAEAGDSEEMPVCAAVAIGSEIIAFSRNRAEELKSPLMHAEFLVVTEAMRILDARFLDEASIYINLEPCYFCAAALRKVRIKEIFFGAYSPRNGAIVHGERVFDNLSRKPLIIGGIQEERCSRMISKFFQKQVRKRDIAKAARLL